MSLEIWYNNLKVAAYAAARVRCTRPCAGAQGFENIEPCKTAVNADVYKRQDLHYLDLFSALADENGALRADIASGSIHLNNEGYNVWREFLVTDVYKRQVSLLFN